MINSTFDFSCEWYYLRKMPALLLLLSVISIACLPVTAHAAKNRNFDHFSTGFPLHGQHVKVDCESCHIKGVFKGTPKICAGCHNGRSASGKPSKHIVTTEACDDCHTTFGWEKVAMDHSSVIADCRSCHAPYPRGHIATTSPCDDCHGTLAWESVRFDHSNITSGCRTCHGTQVPNNHPPISAGDDCGVCHNTRTWQGARFDHSNASDTCSSINCHGNDQPNDHMQTTAECGTCHSTLGWS
ncbi:hypothetical protein, partial [Kaarinaea lacus]